MSKKGENIYKRKDGRWEARFLKEILPDGSRKYGYCYARSYHEAKEKQISAMAEYRFAPACSSTDAPCFAECCDNWLRTKQGRVKDATYVKYVSAIENHIKPQLGSLEVTTLSTAEVEQFGENLLNKESLSDKTVKDILILLRAIITYAGNTFPMPSIEIIYPKEEPRETRVLSLLEQQRFMEYLQPDANRTHFGILLALATGLRLGELCALRWGDISLPEKTLTVRCTMQRLPNPSGGVGQRTKIVFSTPKSKTSLRVIPLTDSALALCRLWCCDNANAFVLTGTEDYMEPRTLQNCLKRDTLACGLEGVHFHTLRHTFATRCVEVDFEIKSLSEILGHSSTRITLDRYVHSSMELKRKNMAKLEAIGF